jgi:hypothetical protein
MFSSRKKSAKSVVHRPKGLGTKLPARRQYTPKDGGYSFKGKFEEEQFPQPKDHRFSKGELADVYFDDRARTIVGIRPRKVKSPPLSKVSTIGKVTEATTETVTISFRRPSGSFSAKLRSASPMSAEGGVPLFALLDSNFVEEGVEKIPTASSGRR